MTVILDACAIIAFFRNEPGADVVENYLMNDAEDCFVHVINLCEVYYDFLRSDDEAAAQVIINDLRNFGVIFRTDLDQEFWQAVGRYKARLRRISLADCFAIVLTNRLGGSVLTSDRREFEPVASQGICPVIFIR